MYVAPERNLAAECALRVAVHKYYESIYPTGSTDVLTLSIVLDGWDDTFDVSIERDRLPVAGWSL